jgi:hypothetical protein
MVGLLIKKYFEKYLGVSSAAHLGALLITDKNV